MDSSAPQQSFRDIVNANKFPAKLWNLVNDPASNAVFWDNRGEIVIINQCLLEKEVLSKGCDVSDKNFKSFHRQLNLYGFKKLQSKAIKGVCKCFQNPNFKRDYPELLHKMTRKTIKYRAKAGANQKKTQQLPDKNQQGGEGSNTTCSSDQCYNPRISQPVVLNGTPVPQEYMSMDQSKAQLSQVILAGKQMPVDFVHPSGFAESTTTFNSSLSLMRSHGNPNSIISQSVCHPEQYLPVSHQQHLEYSTQSLSHPGFYQLTQFLINSGLEESIQVLSPEEISELTTDDIDMELLLQFANTLMPDSSPMNCPVQITGEVGKSFGAELEQPICLPELSEDHISPREVWSSCPAKD